MYIDNWFIEVLGIRILLQEQDKCYTYNFFSSWSLYIYVTSVRINVYLYMFILIVNCRVKDIHGHQFYIHVYLICNILFYRYRAPELLFGQKEQTTAIDMWWVVCRQSANLAVIIDLLCYVDSVSSPVLNFKHQQFAAQILGIITETWMYTDIFWVCGSHHPFSYPSRDICMCATTFRQTLRHQNFR